MQWHQLDPMQTICTSLQTDNHTSTPSLNFTGWMLFLTPNQQCQSTEGKFIPVYHTITFVHVSSVVYVVIPWFTMLFNGPETFQKCPSVGNPHNRFKALKSNENITK